MIRSLNSIILEGSIKDKPERLGDNTYIYNIQVLDFRKNEKDITKRSYTIPVKVYIGRFRALKSDLLKGRELRVVGSIQTRQPDEPDSIPNIFVMAEHIEMKPVRRISTDAKENKHVVCS